MLDLLTVSVRCPWRTLLVAGLFMALAIHQAVQLRPVASIRNIMPGDDPAAQAMNQIIDRFSITDELLLLAQWPDERAGTPEEIDSALVAFGDRLATAVRKDEIADRLCGPVRFRAPKEFRAFIERVMVPNIWHYADETTRKAMRNRLTREVMREQVARSADALAAGGGGGVMARALAQDILALRGVIGPLIAARLAHLTAALSPAMMEDDDGALLAPNGRALLIRVAGLRPVSDLDYARELTHAIRAKAEDANSDGLTLTFAGAYPIAEFAERSIRADMIRSIIIALVFLQILFWLAFRDVASFPLAIVPVGCGCLAGFAVYAQFSSELTPMTAAIGAVLAGLGVDYAIHILSHYRHARREGLDCESAVRQLLTTVGPAMATACGTSVLGLLVVARSQVPALREFAVLGALGLVGALAMTVVLLPALLALLDRARPSEGVLMGAADHGEPAGSINSQMEVSRKCGPRDISMVSLSVFFMACLMLVLWHGWPEFEDDLTVLHPRPNPALATQLRIAELYGNVADPLLVHLQADSEQALIGLAHDVQAQLMSAEARAAGIGGIHSIATWLPDLRSAAPDSLIMNAEERAAVLADFDSVIDASIFDPAALSDYREFIGRLVSDHAPPTLSDLEAFPELDRMLRPRALAGMPHVAHESIMTVFMTQRLSSRAERNRLVSATRMALDDLPGATLTGTVVLGHDAEMAIRREVTRVVEPSTMIVLVWVAFYFRRVGASLLAILPAVAGFVVMIAAMHLLGWKLNLINLLGVAIFAGIGVDNGVLLVSLARKRNAQGDMTVAHPGAWRAALSAMSLTTLSTVLSFSALCWTSTPGIQSLGATVTVGMVGAWVASVGLLAPLLRRP